jgi:hypothetical protein
VAAVAVAAHREPAAMVVVVLVLSLPVHQMAQLAQPIMAVAVAVEPLVATSPDLVELVDQAWSLLATAKTLQFQSALVLQQPRQPSESIK